LLGKNIIKKYALRSQIELRLRKKRTNRVFTVCYPIQLVNLGSTTYLDGWFLKRYSGDVKQFILRIVILFFVISGTGGCAKMAMNSMIGPAVENLQRQNDLDLVCEGTSSFLLLLDSMLESDPDDEHLLMTSTQAFSAYATALDVCGRPERAATVSGKAKKYGLALLAGNQDLQPIDTMELSALQEALTKLTVKDSAALFWAGNGWATWIRYQKGSPAALADLVKVELIMRRVIELDETLYHGGAHLFFGAYFGSKPPMLGGKPEESRIHFEKALAISQREFLPAQLAYAQIYARMMYDRDLFSQLLQEVLDFPIEKRPDIALANQTAKRKASQLLEQVDRYF